MWATEFTCPGRIRMGVCGRSTAEVGAMLQGVATVTAAWRLPGGLRCRVVPMRLRTLALLVPVALCIASLAWAQFRRIGDTSIEAHLARPDSFDGRFHYCR